LEFRNPNFFFFVTKFLMEIVGQKLANASSHHPTIGVLAYGMQHTIGHDVWKGIHAVAKTRDVNVLWLVGDQIRCPFGEFREQANIIYDFANPDTVDGLLIWGGALFPHLDAEEIQRFSARYHPLPIVCMSHVLPGTPSVVVGNYQGMYDVLAHLIEVHGYRRIAFMRGPTKKGGEADERYRAYCDVLKEYNLPYDPALVMAGNNEKLPAARAMRMLLKGRGLQPSKDFEAVAASNDTMALAILHVFQECGIRVPQDVALVGFDDLGPARAVTPPLTTVKYSFETLGRQAANALLAGLAGEDVPEQMVVPLNVIVRESCGCRDANVTRAAVSFEHTTEQPASAGKMSSSSKQAEILTAIQHLIEPRTDMSDWVLSVVEAFLSACQKGVARHGLDVLQEVLRQVVAAEGDVEIWQDIVSVMRNQLEAGAFEPAQRMCVESLCQQARVVIAKMARRAQEAKRLHMAEQEQILREIGARLLTTFEVEGLMDVLAEELPGLDIPACYVTLYEDPQPYAYPQSAPEWSRVCLTYHKHDGIAVSNTPDNDNAAENTGRFPTRQLLPQHVLPDGRRYEFVIMPLYFREHQIGTRCLRARPGKASCIMPCAPKSAAPCKAHCWYIRCSKMLSKSFAKKASSTRLWQRFPMPFISRIATAASRNRIKHTPAC
jgi:DNA-binding LacI/PurR family transcriptional regulator